ncbi:MAG TPA: hypothetical protein VFH17_01865 [Coriobacteriia bacterium]|nr:hypothetical protein [Coriobacteriia bacterium]
MLREYIYLDRNRVEDFLSQQEGGVSHSTRSTETDVGASVDAGINIGIAKLGSRLSAPGLSQEDLRRTTDVALFERLYAHLGETDLHHVDDSSELHDGSMRQGELLELECEIVVSGMANLTGMLGEFQKLAPLMGDSLEGIEGIAAFLGDEIPVRFTVDDEVVAYSMLSPDGLRGDKSDLDGECTALCRVRKVVKSGKRVPLRKFAGMKLTPQQIEEMFSEVDFDDDSTGFHLDASASDYIAEGPCLIVTTVAVYR